MNYSEKLKDRRWLSFREEAIGFHGAHCNTCGNEDRDTSKSLHVHHRVYLKGREPWEYEMQHVAVICGPCHKRIHECEEAWRNFIRCMDPHVVDEWMDTVEVLQRVMAERGQFCLKIVAARMRGQADTIGRSFERID